jgi:hypothetical protein
MRHGGESGGGRPQERTRFFSGQRSGTFSPEAQCVSWSPSSSHHRSIPCLADREVSWVGLSPPPPSFPRDFLVSKVETKAVCQAIYGRRYKLSNTLPQGVCRSPGPRRRRWVPPHPHLPRSPTPLRPARAGRGSQGVWGVVAPRVRAGGGIRGGAARLSGMRFCLICTVNRSV